MNDKSLFLAIDVGTGSVRAALVDRSGAILKLVGQEHQQIVPHYGWAEQRPEDWWNVGQPKFLSQDFVQLF